MHTGLRGDPVATVRHEIEIAPVDTKIIAAFTEDRLILRSQPQYRLTVEQVAGRHDRLIRCVDDELVGSLEVKLDGMGCAVGGCGGPVEVRDGPREDVEIVRKSGREECQVELNTRAGEAVERTG